MRFGVVLVLLLLGPLRLGAYHGPFQALQARAPEAGGAQAGGFGSSAFGTPLKAGSFGFSAFGTLLKSVPQPLEHSSRR